MQLVVYMMTAMYTMRQKSTSIAMLLVSQVIEFHAFSCVDDDCYVNHEAREHLYSHVAGAIGNRASCN